MADLEFKAPTSKAEYEEMKKMLRAEIGDEQLDAIVGGNDDLKQKIDMVWTCPFCGAAVKCKMVQDAAKHMTKCPNNPYK